MMKRKFYFVMIVMIVGAFFVSCEDSSNTGSGSGSGSGSGLTTLGERAGTYNGVDNTGVKVEARLNSAGFVAATIVLPPNLTGTIIQANKDLANKVNDTGTSFTFDTAIPNMGTFEITLNFATTPMKLSYKLGDGSLIPLKEILLAKTTSTVTTLADRVGMYTGPSGVRVTLGSTGLVSGKTGLPEYIIDNNHNIIPANSNMETIITGFSGIPTNDPAVFVIIDFISARQIVLSSPSLTPPSQSNPSPAPNFTPVTLTKQGP